MNKIYCPNHLLKIFLLFILKRFLISLIGVKKVLENGNVEKSVHDTLELSRCGMTELSREASRKSRGV